ncbi:MAG TPA: lytic transglycosylase domain-containing protein [Syntrophorhabdaceae bacterium]
MRHLGKPTHLIISVIVVASFVLATFSVIQAFNGDQGKEGFFIKSKIVEYLKSKKVNASDDKLKTIADRVYEESQEYGVDYRLILAVMKVESNFKNEAVSRKGARGLLQISPSLARHASKNEGITMKGNKSLHEPEKNIKIGVNHMSWLLEKFENLNTALHAYNVGSYKIRNKASKEYSPDTPFTRKVLNEYNKMLLDLPDPDEE